MRSPRPGSGASECEGQSACVQVRGEGEGHKTLLAELEAVQVLSEVPLDETSVTVRLSWQREGSAVPNLVAHWHRRPVALLLLCEADERAAKSALRWVDECEGRQLEWLAVVSEPKSRGRSVCDRLRGDVKRGREEQVVLWEAGLAEAVLPALRRALGATLTRALRGFREHIRQLETRRGTEGWNCAQYIVAQEGLAIVLERAAHAKEALSVYEEATKVLSQESRGVAFPSQWTPDDMGLVSAASWDRRDELYRSHLSVFGTFAYLAGRMLLIVSRSDGPEAVLQRSAVFVRSLRARAAETGAPPAWIRTWAAGAWREVAKLCGAKHWSSCMAEREAALLDGNWEAVASSSWGRAASEGLFRMGRDVSKRIDESWHDLKMADAVAAVQRHPDGQKELLQLWAVSRDEAVLLQALAAPSGADEVSLPDAAWALASSDRRREPLDAGDAVRLWLSDAVSVRIPLFPAAASATSGDAVAGDAGAEAGSLTSAAVASQPASVPSSSVQGPGLEARARVLVGDVWEVRVTCEAPDAVLTSIAGQPVEQRECVLLSHRPEHVLVAFRMGGQDPNPVREVSVPVVVEADGGDEQPRVSCVARIDSGDDAWWVGCPRSMSVRICSSADVVTFSREHFANGLVCCHVVSLAVDGGSDWLIAGPVRRTLAAGEAHTLTVSLVPRRAGQLLVPLPRTRTAGGGIATVGQLEGGRVVSVGVARTLCSATQLGARHGLLDDSDDLAASKDAVSSPDPRMLRFSSPV